MRSGRLGGKRVLITGAAGGQGLAVARRLHEQGAALALTDVNKEGLDRARETLGFDCVLAVADCTDPREVEQAVNRAVTSLGGLDGLYNNAGVYLPDLDAPVDRLDPEIWDRVMAVNAKGVFLFSKYSLPSLLDSGAGVLINVASTAAHAGDRECHAYAASKGSLIALTRSIAQRWGPLGLRAICLCPGFIDTEMVGFASRDPEVAESIKAATALQRFGTADEIAQTATFLLSDEASFISSSIIDVHGGLIK